MSANNRLTFEGLDELRAALRNLPAELAGEAGHIVEAAGNRAAVTIRTKYGQHSRSGNLRDHLTVDKVAAGPFGVAIIVKSSAPHAWLFDNGTQARHWASGKSTGAMWSRTPPTHIFAATMARTRRTMWDQLRELLTRKGLQVSGDA